MWNLIKLIFKFTGASKVATFAAIAIVAWGGFMTWLTLRDRAIMQKAFDDYNKKQEEIYNKKVAEFNQQIENLRKETEELLKKQKEETVGVIKEISDIKKEAAKTGEPVPATPYLKYVIESLGK